jgi:prepilin-type N-terminal cleavage/methylation domain-containing protein
MAPFAHRKPAQRGFTLVELMVALAIAAIVTTGIFQLYLTFVQSAIGQDRVLQMQQNARVALDDLERDLRLAGVDTVRDDPSTPNQAVFAYAAPYELDFNANLDKTLGGLRPDRTPDKVPSALPVGVTPFYDPSVDYPLAETVRWTLDSNGDGIIDASDRADSTNPGLYYLTRQIYGYNAGADSNGPESARAADGVRGPDPYPDGTRPPVLFEYWIKEIDLNDNKAVDAGEDVNGSGKIDFFLWGDDGGTAGTGSVYANNGVLDPPEIDALMTGNGGSPKVIDNFNALITSTTGDARATALTRAQVLSNIARVTVTVVTETAEPDSSYKRSPHGTDYPYREHVVTASASPRNALADITSDRSLTLAASPTDVQCPATSTIVTVSIWDESGSLYTTPVDVDLTTSLGSFSSGGTLPATTVTTSGGTAIAILYGDNNTTTTTAVLSAKATIGSAAYSAGLTVEYLPGPASSVQVVGAKAALPADGLSTTGVTATVLDACGKPAGDGDPIVWSLTTLPPGIGGSVAPAAGTIAGNSATTVLTSGLSSGLATVLATDTATGASGAGTVNFTDCMITVTPESGSLPADGTSQTPVEVVITDTSGTPQPNVNADVTTTDGSVSPGAIITDGAGKATFTLTSSTTPHVAALTVSVPSSGGYCAFAMGTAEVDFSDCGLTVASDVTEVVPGSPGGQAVITATVSDSGSGTALAGQQVAFTMGGSDGAISPASASTDGSGHAVSTFTAGPTTGVATITAQTGCGTGTVDVYVRDCLVSVHAEPATVRPAAGNTSLITATLTDSVAGTALAGRQVTFSLDNPSLADFSGATTVTTDVKGEASVSIVTKGLSGIVTVTATSECGSSSAKVVLNDWQISIATDKSDVPKGSTATLTATVTLGGVPTDPASPDDVVTLSFEAPGGLGSTIAPGSATTVSGTTTHTFTAGSTPGTVTVKASATVGGLPITATVDIVVTSGSGVNDLVLDPGSPDVCGASNDIMSFRVHNIGFDDLVITGIQITWGGGGELERVKSEGAVSGCAGGSDVWRYNACGLPDGRQSSPATLTDYCKSLTISQGTYYTFNSVQYRNVDLRSQPVTVIITHQPLGGGPSATSTITFNEPSL